MNKSVRDAPKIHVLRLKQLLQNDEMAVIAARASSFLPNGDQLTESEVRAYAEGRALPAQPSHVQALEKALGLEAGSLHSAELTGRKSPFRRPRQMDARAERSAEVPLQLAVTPRGDVRLKFAQEVPWPVALEVLKRLKGG